MNNITFIILLVSAVFFTAAVCMTGFITRHRRSYYRQAFKYPVPEDQHAAVASHVLEEEATPYNVAEKKKGELTERFKLFMAEKKPYLNSRVSKDSIAVRLGTNKTTLSKLINDKFGMNFRQLLNSYRVKEAIDLLSNDNNISMEDLRKAAGFNSVSTFTSSFSRFTGYTPGEYCKRTVNR